MALILHIDTAVDTASVCLAKDGELIALRKNELLKDHAAWLQPAIAEMIKAAGYGLQELKAVAVTIGPGSYTGLRIGLASAKGICYGLTIPLLAINTPEVMANAAGNGDADLLCPMIDARRMEVFTAVYDKKGEEVIRPQTLIITEDSFSELLSSNKILFFGNGSLKFKNLCKQNNALFKLIAADASHMITIAGRHYSEEKFADLAYTEPLYLKEFHNSSR
jgi:tRNA threonylcarbamoyladenosine biosynthesis protein TsaB